VVELRREFDRELEAIEAKVIELFALVAEDLPGVTEALLSGNNEVIGQLGEREQVINALYREVEQLVGREILLRAPVASDLRFLLSVLRIAPELERSHDLECQIAARATRDLSAGLSPRCRGLVERMGNLGCDMWRQAADSWYQRDDSAASVLADADNEMDELRASLVAELASGQMELPVAMEMTLVARFYERLGDHAVNVARRVIYLAGSRRGEPRPAARGGLTPGSRLVREHHVPFRPGAAIGHGRLAACLLWQRSGGLPPAARARPRRRTRLPQLGRAGGRHAGGPRLPCGRRGCWPPQPVAHRPARRPHAAAPRPAAR